jgi:hypothetical protein
MGNGKWEMINFAPVFTHVVNFQFLILNGLAK